jgi:hypothetical protein
LERNPTAQLKIAAYGSNTEGGNTSENRLTFMRQFLKGKQFNNSQLNFENNKANAHSKAVADRQIPSNQRIEIRILTP